jgi:hypothetical protein
MWGTVTYIEGAPWDSCTHRVRVMKVSITGRQQCRSWSVGHNEGRLDEGVDLMGRNF